VSRPVIGVTLSRRSAWRVHPFFAWAVRRADGRTARIDGSERRRGTCEGLDALIVGGGDDIGVDLYGGQPMPQAVFDQERDELEATLLRDARARALPVLGVCRGAQLLNVIRGGTLHQNIWETYPEARRIKTPLPRKRVEVLPGTLLASFYGTEPSRVNALHTQSVDALGYEMQVAARDEVGMVQAVEATSGPFAIGVQWHPEFLVFSRRDFLLFRELVAAARGRAS